ncbi:fused response regulator/phosphatase [Sulfurimonas sp. SWIR-19]|uniref:response regulator n=1 Tax=Sulfurimonas sp. SWIR-19 TaxID=2878390 RepID=UPI001CF5FA0B|nr:response regulator [Sulfurimonas sp. SWIR-19]UCM99334.1 fused response regulator/phosphatase [Sulfurimonas sp. SWIR-19]
MNDYISDIYKTLDILCVESDPKTIEIYKKIFPRMFKNLYCAKNGLEGLEYFQKNEIDIVITRYNMPVCNGLQMSRKIRKIDASVPIIMVTSLQSIDILKEAIDLHITGFLKRPFTTASLLSVFNQAVKSIIVDRCIMKEQSQKITYSTYQEGVTFAKEKIITKNDLQEEERLFNLTCKVVYKPKDILSGDSYIIRKINENEYFIFLVDGMGKGISASVTAMLCSSFVNYSIDVLKEEKKSFSLEKLLRSLLTFIQPNLLQYEVLCAHFMHFNQDKKVLNYAIFSMPPVLYMLDTDEVCKLKSNNTPLASYTKKVVLNTLDLQKLSKMLIYSDGLNENIVHGSQENYNTYITEDFQRAESVEEFEYLYQKKIKIQEDDITYILLT